MNRMRLLIALSTLVVALAFYLAFRPDRTCSNRFLGTVLGAESYEAARSWIGSQCHMPGPWLGSLPSGLWVIAATCLVGGWEWRLTNGKRLSLAVLPVLINSCWELVQWSGFTDGRADLLDIGAGVAGWAIAASLPFTSTPPAVPIHQWYDWRWLVLAGTCLLMGFADVT
ncbi:MAG: hypothetical protein ACKV19_14505 [Verrucomicrobiales bacterium]